jgi:hypothetical protein
MLKALLVGAVVMASTTVAIAQSVLPVGSIVAYSGASAPSGWLLCNGEAIPAGSQFNQLRTLIGPKTPDLRGYFLWDSMPQETLTLIPKQSRERCFQSSQMRLGLIPTPILVHFTTLRESPAPTVPISRETSTIHKPRQMFHPERLDRKTWR